MVHRRLLLAVCCLAFVAGCAAPLNLDEARYRSRAYDSPNAVPQIAPPPEVILDKEPMENLALLRARELALLRNHGTQAAAATVEAARARISEARAAFLPTVDMSIQREAFDEATVVTIPGGGSFQLTPFYRTTASAQLALSLFAFGRDWEALKAAQADLTTQILDERAVRQQLLFEVTQAWYRVHEADAQVQVAQDALAASRRQFDDAINVVQAGRATPDAELTAKVEWLRRKQEVLVAENAVVHARRVLNTLLVRELDAPIALAPAPPYERARFDAESLKVLGRSHNPRLLAFRSQRLALDHTRESIERSFAPEFVGTLQASYSDFTESTGFSTNYIAAIGAQWRPIDAGRRIGRLQEIHATLVALREEELQAIQDLDLQVTRTILDLQESESAVEIAREAIGSAEENYRIISERFRNGKTTARELLDAQTTLSNSRFSYNQARFGHRTLLASLEALIGVAQDDWLTLVPSPETPR
jgi:outer membrane protein